MVWLNFIATEIHKGLGPLWKPTTPDAYKAEGCLKTRRHLSLHVDGRRALPL